MSNTFGYFTFWYVLDRNVISWSFFVLSGTFWYKVKSRFLKTPDRIKKDQLEGYGLSRKNSLFSLSGHKPSTHSHLEGRVMGILKCCVNKTKNHAPNACFSSKSRTKLTWAPLTNVSGYVITKMDILFHVYSVNGHFIALFYMAN